MKRLKLILIILFLVCTTFGQQWRISLTSGDTYHPVTLDSLKGNTLVFHHRLTGISTSIPLERISFLEFLELESPKMFKRFFCCFPAGFMAGGMATARFITYSGSYPVLVGFAAGLFAAVVDAKLTAKSGNIGYNLSQMTTEEKMKTIQEIMEKRKK